MEFGISAEGIKDQVVLQNILYGVFNDVEDFDEDEIAFLQPFQDATDRNSPESFGSWTVLFSYLSSDRFKEDVINNTDYLIVQIDSDICEETNLYIKRVDDDNQPLTIEHLIKNIIERLITEINANEKYADFYDRHENKIIFAICVESLECWLYKYYEKEPKKIRTEKVHNCYDDLVKVVTRYENNMATEKTAKNYKQLSKPFRKLKTIKQIRKVDTSFDNFIVQLEDINYP